MFHIMCTEAEYITPCPRTSLCNSCDKTNIATESKDGKENFDEKYDLGFKVFMNIYL